MKVALGLLKPDDVGLWVVYVGHRLSAHDGHYPMPAVHEEWGRVKSWNDQWVFVVYKCAGQWDDFASYTAAATDPEDLYIPTAQQLQERLAYWDSPAREWDHDKN